jgi:excisionase family DNA binding protein
MSENVIGTTEAAIIAGRHKRTVVAWIRKGMLPAKKLPGKRGQYLIEPEDLESFLKDYYTPRPYTPSEDQKP